MDNILLDANYRKMINPLADKNARIEAGKALVETILEHGPTTNQRVKSDLTWLLENSATPQEVRGIIEYKLNEHKPLETLLREGKYDVLIGRLEAGNQLGSMIALSTGCVATETRGSGSESKSVLILIKQEEKTTYNYAFDIPGGVVAKANEKIRPLAEKLIVSSFKGYCDGSVTEKALSELIHMIFTNPAKVGEEAVAKANVANAQLEIINREEQKLPVLPIRGWHPIIKRNLRKAEKNLDRTKEAAFAAVRQTKAKC